MFCAFAEASKASVLRILRIGKKGRVVGGRISRARGVPKFWNRLVVLSGIMAILENMSLFPGHALREKGLQRQKGVGPLVSSKEQRALLVPLVNCG